MFRFLTVATAFLGFCYYAFTTVEQSDGARYRAEIGQLQEQVATLAQERDSVATERDAIKAELEEIEAGEQTDAVGESAGAPTPQPAEG